MSTIETFENLDFYRGVSSRYATDRPAVLKTRTDRRPRHSSAAFHDTADQWFRGRFGIAYRSEALFVTSRKFSAQTYAASPAHVFRTIPLGEYRYCWSPQISDLLFLANETVNSDVATIHRLLNSAEYKEDGLRDAYSAGHEVMLFCESYIAIPVDMLPGANNAPVTSILLP